MPAPAYAQGEVLLARLVFSSGQGDKRRPVLVVHDFGDDDLRVVPVTSHPARVGTDVVLANWKEAGLRFPSTVRVEKLATIEKNCVVRKLGEVLVADLGKVRGVLAMVFKSVLEQKAKE